jgi:hypothetical protein
MAANERRCWLCLNCKHEVGQAMHNFILHNVSRISTGSITEMVVGEIMKLEPEGNRDTIKAQVKEHIEGKHMLCPSLQIAHMLRNLIELKETLHGMIITENEDGVQTVDAKYMAMYLKVISEIMQIYKTGEVSKLLFASEQKE